MGGFIREVGEAAGETPRGLGTAVGLFINAGTLFQCFHNGPGPPGWAGTQLVEYLMATLDSTRSTTQPRCGDAQT